MAEESAASVATNPSAPAAERYDATVAVHDEGLVGLVPSAEMSAAIEMIQEGWRDQELAKAARGNLIKGPWKQRDTERGGHSVFLDDFQIQAQGAYWDRPGVLGFESMRAMVQQTPILNSIIMTRIRQVNRFCRPQSNKTDAGFVIQHVDPTVELGDEQQKSVKLLSRFMVNCGWEMDPRRRKRMKRDSFAQFMAKSVRDTLTMDAAPIETEFKRDRSLGLDGFYAVDGATIRLCTEQGYEGDDEIFALQVVQGNIRTAYTYDDLIYEVRNPRTDVTACGYGYSETEMLIRIVTYLLNSMTYNGSFFDKNSIPRGMLNLVGNYDPGDLAAFKRYWNAMLRGAQNAHNMPIMVAKDGESKSEFVEIGGQLNEMAFAKWISFLTSIACAIFGVAPEEISMESFSDGKSSLSGSDTQEKLVSANDKGLRPLLGHYENLFSDFIIQVFSPDYCFRFAGLDVEDAKQRFERQKLSLTWNELRGQDGMDPIPGKVGDAPLNPVLTALWSQETGIGQPPQPEPEEEDFGDPAAQGGAGESGPPGDGQGGDEGGGDEAAPGGAGDAPDFGKPPANSETADLKKALTGADFGFPPIYKIEA
jgi:hypothetical protein